PVLSAEEQVRLFRLRKGADTERKILERRPRQRPGRGPVVQALEPPQRLAVASLLSPVLDRKAGGRAEQERTQRKIQLETEAVPGEVETDQRLQRPILCIVG